MALGKKHGYWIHHKRETENSTSGFFYLPVCDCSVCGKTVNMEKKICPYCGAVMDETPPKEEVNG